MSNSQCQKLPALTRAEKLQKRASRAGFDWPDVTGVLDKVREEARELADAAQSGDKDLAEDELGDMLFTIVNLARHLKLDPEAAVRRANDKFASRFRAAEKAARASDRNLSDLTPEELDVLPDGAGRPPRGDLPELAVGLPAAGPGSVPR